ncbi:N-alpha-acetyltransferase 80-like [Lineus longissimus]|uniref:N-alpha-acetyltransferase 80-like n=1 Tax=Lineus longissimus TaxID=88925 RepID=UPI002B4DE7E0
MSVTKVLPLHHNQEHMEGCIDVLGEEWKRSRAARRYTLEKSCDRYPNLVFLKDKEVVGHSKLSQVVGRDDACFVESVVVAKKLRGLGHGSDLMAKTEEYARRIGMKTIYLTTHDKEGFYERVGYSFCEPVFTCSCKADFMNNFKISSMLQKLALSQSKSSNNTSKSTNLPERGLRSDKTSPTPTANSVPIPPAPAPPPPPPPAVKMGETEPRGNISWMKKELVV